MRPTTSFADRYIQAEQDVCTQNGLVSVKGEEGLRMCSSSGLRFRLFRRPDGVLGFKNIETLPSRGRGIEGICIWFEFDDGSCIDIIEEFNPSAIA